jgi:hypothetical protein
LNWPEIWKGWKGKSGPEPNATAFIDLVLKAPKNFNPWLVPVLQPRFQKACEEAFRAAVEEKYRQIRNWASFAPDLWSLFSFDSMHRNNSFSNLTSLRFFTSERNLFHSSRIWKLFLTVPCYKIIRMPDAVIINAIKAAKKSLLWIPNANSWLPARFPQSVHLIALSARSKIATVRNNILNIVGSTSIAGSGGWTRFDRLLRLSPILREKMECLVCDPAAFPEEMFDRRAVGKLWQEHLNGVSDHANQLYQLACFGEFRRRIYSNE